MGKLCLASLPFGLLKGVGGDQAWGSHQGGGAVVLLSKKDASSPARRLLLISNIIPRSVGTSLETSR